MHDKRRDAAPDGTALRELIMGFRASQLIYVAAKLGIADRLHDGPQTVAELAGAAGAAPQPLYRLLRALASLGIFAETDDGSFELTPTARLLQSDVPGSLRSTALLYGDEVFWAAYGQMVHSVVTGEPAFRHCHGEPLFPYLATHPRAAALFHEAMSGFSDRETTAILDAYDFSGLSKVVDVGGGHGALIAALLNAHPNLYGVILDLETAADGARQLVAEAGVAQRAVFVPGDFFSAVPRGGDAYVLKSVIHNWDDEAATRILRACRKAMRSDARLIAIERVIPPGNAASEAKLFDINMLVSVGGQERTEEEYRRLFHGAGLRLTRIVPTRSPLGLIEGIPANGT
jgi:hypothetical protein